MSLRAVVTAYAGRIDANSTVTILDCDQIIAEGAIPAQVNHADVLIPARICAALYDLGYRPVGGDYYNALTQGASWVEVLVEPLP